MYNYHKLTPEQRAEQIKQRLKNGYPPHSPPHPIVNEQYYLITAVCYQHQHRMKANERRQQILEQLFTIFLNEGIEIRAWVVLLNHYHFLTSTVNFPWLSQQLRLVHGRLARQWNLEDNLHGKVWYSYSDRAIRSERHYYTTLNYIHYNPVKHKLVDSPYDWQESSVHWYLQENGREWLRSCWVEYPVKDYGKGWDDL